MSAAYLAPLDRAELDELIRVAEHGERVAHIALNAAPLRFDALADACGVAQDVMCLLHDARLLENLHERHTGKMTRR